MKSSLILLMSVFSAVAGESHIRNAIQKLSPGVSIDSIKPAAIKGVYEVVVGGQTLYLSEDGKYLVQGQMIDTASRKNLSEQSLAGLRQISLKALDAKQLIVFSPKKVPAKHRVKIFTDSDCGFCRKLHNEIAQYQDLGIEVQYLFFPRGGLNSASAQTAQSVYCAKDQQQAMSAAQAGQAIPIAHCPNPVESHYQLGLKLGVGAVGTPSIVLDNGQLIPGYLPAPELLAAIQRAQ
jgi:thiol:disulfide interchange protein DsbC